MALPPDSRDKIRLKCAPTQYKRGAGPTGLARLDRSAYALLVRAQRMARQPTTGALDARYAEELARVLRAYLDGSLPPV